MGGIDKPLAHRNRTSGTGLIIRRFQDGDHDAVWALHNLALHQVGAHAGNGPWDDDLHHVTAVYLAAGGEFLVGLDRGDRLVAMGALRPRDDETAEVTRMRVHPEGQRRGFGRAILRRLEERAAELGYRRLVLTTTEHQGAAIALYRSEGFIETGRGEVLGFPCLFFARDLPARAEPGARSRHA